MSAQTLMQAAKLPFTKENGFLVLVLTGLVVAENFVEKDFHCPCKSDFRKTLVFFYLFIPAFVIFAVVFCIMCELGRQKSNEETQKQKSNEETQKQKSNEETQKQKSNEETQKQKSNEETQKQKSNRGTQICGRPNGCSCKQIFFFILCSIPSIFWILLFFCDGRYWACYHTTFEGDADSTKDPPWEWCNTNRTLTAAQKKAERAYNDSKYGGFIALLVISFILLMSYIIFDCCCREHGASSEQTRAEQGAAGAQESSGQRTTTHMVQESEMTLLQGTAGTEEGRR